VDGWTSGWKSVIFGSDCLIFVCLDALHLEPVENEFVDWGTSYKDVSRSDEQKHALQEILL
jgi:hypothetical protein